MLHKGKTLRKLVAICDGQLQTDYEYGITFLICKAHHSCYQEIEAHVYYAPKFIVLFSNLLPIMLIYMLLECELASYANKFIK